MTGITPPKMHILNFLLPIWSTAIHFTSNFERSLVIIQYLHNLFENRENVIREFQTGVTGLKNNIEQIIREDVTFRIERKDFDVLFCYEPLRKKMPLVVKSDFEIFFDKKIEEMAESTKENSQSYMEKLKRGHNLSLDQIKEQLKDLQRKNQAIKSGVDDIRTDLGTLLEFEEILKNNQSSLKEAPVSAISTQLLPKIDSLDEFKSFLFEIYGEKAPKVTELQNSSLQIIFTLDENIGRDAYRNFLKYLKFNSIIVVSHSRKGQQSGSIKSFNSLNIDEIVPHNNRFFADEQDRLLLTSKIADPVDLHEFLQFKSFSLCVKDLHSIKPINFNGQILIVHVETFNEETFKSLFNSNIKEFEVSFSNFDLKSDLKLEIPKTCEKFTVKYQSDLKHCFKYVKRRGKSSCDILCERVLCNGDYHRNIYDGEMLVESFGLLFALDSRLTQGINEYDGQLVSPKIEIRTRNPNLFVSFSGDLSAIQFLFSYVGKEKPGAIISQPKLIHFQKNKSSTTDGSPIISQPKMFDSRTNLNLLPYLEDDELCDDEDKN